MTTIEALKIALVYIGSFILGGLVVFAPMLVWAYVIHMEETARHEPTMAPGITTFLGLLIAPLAGSLAVSIVYFLRRGGK